MATQLQMRSGTTLQNDIFTGAPGEITYDTEKKNLRIHDGETVGGLEIASAGAADYVVEWQTPTEANGYTWYRKYKSGWVEQGGVQQNVGSTAGYRDITLPIEMSGANYTINTTCYSSYTSGTASSHAYVMEKGAVAYNQTSTGFQVFAQEQASGSYIHWQVSGMAA